MDWIMGFFPELTPLGIAVTGCLILVGIIMGIAMAYKDRNKS